jgi:MFS family permease
VGNQVVDQVQRPGAKPSGIGAGGLRMVASAQLNETPYAWFVVLALALTNMAAFLERQIVTLLYGPIKADFHISDTQVSLLSGAAFILFGTVFGLFFGRLADRANRKWIITLGVVAWSAATMACGLTRSFGQLFAARIAVGVGEATLSPSAMSLVADYFPRRRLARGMSVYTSSVSAGAGLALVAGGAAIQFVGGLPPLRAPFVGPLAPWQMTFVLVSLCGLVVLLPLAFVKEPARRDAIGGEDTPPRLTTGEVLAHLFRQRRFYFYHCAGFSLATVLAAGGVSWIPTFFIRHHHWAPQQIGYAYGLIVAVCGVVGVLAGARIAEWMDARGCRDTNVRLPLIALALAAVPTVLVPVVADPRVALGLLALSSVIGSVATAPIWAALQMVTPNQMRGQVVALFAFIANVVGMGLGPLVVALFTDFIFRDEARVGSALVLATLVLKPIVLVCFWRCLRGYTEALTAYDLMVADGRPA